MKNKYKENEVPKSCFYHENSGIGFICKNCSSSGKEYFIKCAICLADLFGELHPEKKDKDGMTVLAVTKSNMVKIREHLCEKHKGAKEIPYDHTK